METEATAGSDYPQWRCTRSNEDFDRAQALAVKLAEQEPGYNGVGYTAQSFDRAMAIVRSAQTH